MRTLVFSVRHFTIVVRTDIHARVNKVSCKQAIYLVLLPYLENKHGPLTPDLDCYNTIIIIAILLLNWIKIISEKWWKKRLIKNMAYGKS